jgi:formylglycine-generating enzyme required for sulfatase activity
VSAIVGTRINRHHLTAQWRRYTLTMPDGRSQIWSKVRPYVLSAAQEQALKPGDSFEECSSECPDMIVVPAGTFLMGSPADEPGRQTSEQPLHQVTIARPFVSKFELSFADWDACAADGGCDAHIKDSGFGRGPQPVINVTWDDARRYAAWLAKTTGKPYRLPSEAEYEYAERAGTQTAYPWGDVLGKNNANCNGCGSRWDDMQTAPVGSFPPNRFGLYDIGRQRL